MTRNGSATCWGLGGTTDWVTDLQKYHKVPAPAQSWAMFIELIYSGEDPKADHTRNSNWTDMDCTRRIARIYGTWAPCYGSFLQMIFFSMDWTLGAARILEQKT
ncbi:hypothetical protein IFM61392_00863 [Aspergillus lentulus]|nr:hypothetical protein IFM61392_00863 [Aspergillus lentulus]